MRATFTCGYFVKSPDQEVFSVPLLWIQNWSPVSVFRKKCPQVPAGRQQVFMILWLCSLTNASIMINTRKLCPPYQKPWTVTKKLLIDYKFHKTHESNNKKTKLQVKVSCTMKAYQNSTEIQCEPAQTHQWCKYQSTECRFVTVKCWTFGPMWRHMEGWALIIRGQSSCK